jgi:hypothetical protein
VYSSIQELVAGTVVGVVSSQVPLKTSKSSQSLAIIAKSS